MKAKFAEINKAYETLVDTEKRQVYDQTVMSREKASGFDFGGFNCS